MQNTSLLLVFLHQLGQLILDICIKSKYILQLFSLDRRTIMLISFYLYLLKLFYALLCLYVDVNAYHFISEDDSKRVSFDPRSIRSWLQGTHPDFLDDFSLDVEFNLRRIDFGKAKGQPEPCIFVLSVLYFRED